MLRLMPVGAEHLGFGSEIATTLLEPGGAFTFLNVPAGSYTLLASPGVLETGGSLQGALPRGVGYGPAQGYSWLSPVTNSGGMWWRSRAGETAWGRLPINVGGADLNGVVLPLRNAATVNGRIVFDDPNPPGPAERFFVGLEPADGDPSLGFPNTFTAANDRTFSFTLTGLQAGRYLMRYHNLGPWRVKSVVANGTDVTLSGFDGASGQVFNDVVLTMMRATGAISGVVTDQRGQPAIGSVMLFPADPARWFDYGVTPDRLRSVATATDGAYSITPLLDGEYFVVAVPARRFDGWWLDPKFLAAASKHATRVTLTGGATRTQNLQLSEVVVR
jgi:hypothetical protein